MPRVMSDTEIRRRKKIQGHISQTTSTLGLAGLGVTGAAALAARKPGVLKAVRKVPKLGSTTPEKMKNAAITTGLVSGGIGGVGGFNFASYTGAESRKKRPAMPVTPKPTMQKSLGVEPPYVGEVAKEWKPSTSKFDAEAARMRRSGAYETAGGAVSGALGAAAGVKGAQAGRLVARNYTKGQRKAKHLPNVKAAQAARKTKALGHGKVGLGLLGAAGAVGAGTLAVRNRNQSRSWAPYSKRDTMSAFGVEHGEVSKKVLTQEARDKIKSKNFAMPKSKSYPIQDRVHARNALARAAQKKTKGSYKAVAAKVHEKFPEIGKAARTPEQEQAFRANRERTKRVAAGAGGAYLATGGAFTHAVHRHGKAVAALKGSHTDLASAGKAAQRVVSAGKKVKTRGALFGGTALLGAGAMAGLGQANTKRYARASKG